MLLTIELNSVAFAYPYEYNVQYFGETIHNSIVDRYISINGTNITASGFTFNVNNTWRVANSTQNASFPSIWVDMVLGIPDQEYWPIRRYELVSKYNSRGLSLIFASDYNGTHYREAIIIGAATAMWGRSLTTVDNKTGITYGSCQIFYEENRTEFVGKNVTSKYNPSSAIFTAVNFMKNKSWNYDNVTHIFLLPREYLIEEYMQFDFVWNMMFLHTINSSERELMELNHFIIAPNATILNYTHLIMRKAILLHPCSDCNSSNGTLDILLYMYLSIGSITFIAITIVLYVVLRKKKHSKLSANA